MADAAIEKTTKASPLRATTSRWARLPEANGAASTRMFFDHWRGRSARTSPRATPPAGFVTWGGSVAVVTPAPLGLLRSPHEPLLSRVHDLAIPPHRAWPAGKAMRRVHRPSPSQDGHLNAPLQAAFTGVLLHLVSTASARSPRVQQERTPPGRGA